MTKLFSNLKNNLPKIYLLISSFVLLLIFLIQIFNIYALIIGIPLIILTIYLGSKNIPKFPLILFILMFLIRLLVVCTINTPVISDFSIILNTAKNLLIGHNTLNTETYFYTYAYQTGPVLYTYALLKICNSVLFLKIVNCLFSSLNCVLIYYLSKKFSSPKSARIISILYGLLSFPLFFNTVLSNQIPGSTCFYLALLILLNNFNSLKSYIISALLLSIGNLIRCEGIIFICALIGLYFFYLISKKASKKMHIGMLLLVIIYFLLNSLFSFTVTSSGLNHEGLSNNYSNWKFILGLNQNTCGTYNEEDFKYMVDNETSKKEIINRLASLNPKTLTDLVTCKANITWSGGNLYWTFANLSSKNYHFLGITFNNNSLEETLNSLNKLIYYTAFILMFIGLSKELKNKETNLNILLFVNILAINFIVYSLIEVQPRYIYLFQISIFILASLGIDAMWPSKRKEE